MTAYYNENDKYAAQWLRNLIAEGLISDGEVDERSIEDIKPDDLRGFTRCHFFAGIAGWDLALQLAGWPGDREVWTGSCPCQPLSCAGQRKGHVDKRHLWAAFYRLISECKPAMVFGEQVGGKDGLEWLAAVRADLERIGYAVGAANLPACSIGAPHIRQRLWFVADAERQFRRIGANELAGAASENQSAGHQRQRLRDDIADGGESKRLAEAVGQGLEIKREQSARQECTPAERGRAPWDDIIWLSCSDGKARPVKSSIQPLAHGISARVGKLRAAGNAIVPQAAAEFVKAFMDCRP